ncbi:hypothetical protein FPQ18DRAFT_307711 [Pyronema domesticum]|uniref:Uncharacterized protein n=1 Tax=Pyronema omphalodes (strain CBS 100304) TaxID=1076935 RepID=U4LEU6_PYROM|nr:hypothetical protein FPQ18DRAFT_307711 [Pyronema domesticum]CCX30072.1 Protein of unknown function [Pyronema omphalodes CBS 100304]
MSSFQYLGSDPQTSSSRHPADAHLVWEGPPDDTSSVVGTSGSVQSLVSSGYQPPLTDGASRDDSDLVSIESLNQRHRLPTPSEEYDPSAPRIGQTIECLFSFEGCEIQFHNNTTGYSGWRAHVFQQHLTQAQRDDCKPDRIECCNHLSSTLDALLEHIVFHYAMIERFRVDATIIDYLRAQNIIPSCVTEIPPPRHRFQRAPTIQSAGSTSRRSVSSYHGDTYTPRSPEIAYSYRGGRASQDLRGLGYDVHADVLRTSYPQEFNELDEYGESERGSSSRSRSTGRY